MKCYKSHGDVNFHEDKLPDVKGVKISKGFVIERGEGVHSHTLVEGDVDMYMDGDTMYLKVNTPAVITHEEHGPMTIEPGIYRKEIENEYDAESDEARKTQD
jgi:hypothetical protein